MTKPSEPWDHWQSSDDCVKEVRRLAKLRDNIDRQIQAITDRAVELWPRDKLLSRLIRWQRLDH